MSPDAASGTGDAGPLERLLRVQDLDTAITQLEHRRTALPERRQLAELEATASRLAAQAAEAQHERDALAARLAEIEAQVATIAARRHAIEQRLYGARGTPARDLQAMDEEIGHLAQRQSELEDAELELMEAQEPIDATLGALSQERGQLTPAAEALRHAMAAVEAVIDAELAGERAARAVAAGGVPPDLLGRYEQLRARLGGVGAARLVGARCGGCHLELPSMEVERIRHQPPGAVVTCEQCGRILVPSSVPPPPPPPPSPSPSPTTSQPTTSQPTPPMTGGSPSPTMLGGTECSS